MAMKFRKVPKSKGVARKYIKGSRNKTRAAKEIKRTARLYKMGLLTPAMMNRISKFRAGDTQRRNAKKKK
jgi:hypothetical protein|tara:strand:- start:369 stop:578 length:210 start_codon:yes stop_codon:yes gene_type:complete